MRVSIRFPDVVPVPADVPILTVSHRTWTTQTVLELARRLDVAGDVVDTGLWLVSRDHRAVLEVYQASQSFRFSRVDLDGEAREGVERPPTADDARRVAQAWMKVFAPEGAQAEVHSVTEHEILVADRNGDKPRGCVGGLDVNYRFAFGGLALLGPGAKAKVAVHHTGVVSSGYCFWRNVVATGAMRTLPIERIFDRFTSSALFVDLTNDNARAEVYLARFGYLCLPPTEAMSVLIPALEFRGTIATAAQPRYDFVSHVAAVELDDVKAKQARLFNARPALLLA